MLYLLTLPFQLVTTGSFLEQVRAFVSASACSLTLECGRDQPR